MMPTHVSMGHAFSIQCPASVMRVMLEQDVRLVGYALQVIIHANCNTLQGNINVLMNL